MNSADFSARLCRLAQELSLGGRLELTCPPRTDRTPVPCPDPLDDLIANYDTSTFASHGIDFQITAREYRRWRAVGTYGDDIVAVDPASGEVQLIEWGTDHVLSPVAATTARFLDALALAVEFAGRCLVDSRMYDDQTEKNEYAARCGTAAGGDRYRPFYDTLLGYEY